MLLQTNSYVVPKERRAEHQRLMRRFRQTLARLGCEHFEVYEQVGANWTTSDNGGRYVQIMRFRDRRHQSAVQSAERADPGAQAVIAEFCNLINFPYQQQQNLFAVGYYQSALPVTLRREATRAEVAASDGAAATVASPAAEQAESESGEEQKAQAQGEIEKAQAREDERPAEEPESRLADESDVPVDEDSDVLVGEDSIEEEVEVVGIGSHAAVSEEAHGADLPPEADAALDFELDDLEMALVPDQEIPVSKPIEAAEKSAAGVEASNDDEAAGEGVAAVVEEHFGDEAFEALTPEQPALAAQSEGPIDDRKLPAEAEYEALQEVHESGHEHPVAAEVAGEFKARAESEAVSDVGQEEPPVLEEGCDNPRPNETVELSAEEGDIEIVYEQLPATAEEAVEQESAEPTGDEDSGFDALLSSEQLVEGLDTDDESDHGAAHLAELQAHGVAGGQNGKPASATANGDLPYAQSASIATHQGRIR
jgi:hypothetical protein